VSEQSPRLLLLAPMGLEVALVRRGAPDADVVRAGIGPRRARRTAKLAATRPAAGVAVAGFGGGLAPELEPGEIVVATELRARDGRVIAECTGAAVLAGMLRRAGLSAHTGPVLSVRAPVFGRQRESLRATGAMVVDQESAWLAPAAAGRPFIVVRAVLDTRREELDAPWRAAARAFKAAHALKAAAAVLSEWAQAIAPREAILAAPRASCAGVERAIEAVERALEQFGPPVYMRKQIVHNRHVVAELERRGAICVDELEEVPNGATVVFSAHGVSPQVREEAQRRQLNVVDATCPLVNKVHAEARRFAAGGFTIFLIGHEGHEEVDGTSGEVPEKIRVLDPDGDVGALQVADPDKVAYLTQTTLAVDETSGTVERLKQRFPEIVGPRSDDICYATQNRQDAVRELASLCELVLVVGSRNSSNSNRLVEVAQRAGCDARLLDDESQLDPSWLRGVRTIGVTAGASSPERIVQRVVRALEVLGPLQRSERSVANETVRFALPAKVRGMV
jgi:4-hydroxy-3-methylbut-2-enyl diphosphate reductase